MIVGVIMSCDRRDVPDAQAAVSREGAVVGSSRGGKMMVAGKTQGKKLGGTRVDLLRLGLRTRIINERTFLSVWVVQV